MEGYTGKIETRGVESKVGLRGETRELQAAIRLAFGAARDVGARSPSPISFSM